MELPPEAIIAAFGTVVELASLTEKLGLWNRVRTLLGHDKRQIAFRKALDNAYGKLLAKSRAQTAYPGLPADLFDKVFLRDTSTRFLEHYLRATNPPDLTTGLVEAWADQLGPMATHVQKDSIVRAAADFIDLLDTELLLSQDLRDVLDSRRLKSIDEGVWSLTEGLQALPARIAAEMATHLRPTVVDIGPEFIGSELKRPPSDEWLLPIPEPFVGRQQDLSWLLDRLTGTMRIAALHGMGGIGKTALAAATVHRLREDGRFHDGIAVLLCEGVLDESVILRGVLGRFDPQRQEPEDVDFANLAELARRVLGGRDALIVLDNIEPGLPVEKVVAPLRAAGAALLLTARQILPRGVIPTKAVRALGLLSSGEALSLFVQSWGRHDSGGLTDSESMIAERIVAALGRHTLAVRLAGSYAGDLGRNLDLLAKELEDAARALELPDEETPAVLKRTFLRSVDALPENARLLFSALSVFRTNEFSRNSVLALASGLGIPMPDNALHLLVRRALLDASQSDGMPSGSDCERLQIHPLLRALATSEVAALSEGQQDIARDALAQYYIDYLSRFTTKDTLWALGLDEDNIVGVLAWAANRRLAYPVAMLCLGMADFWYYCGRPANGLQHLWSGVSAAWAAARRTDDRHFYLCAARLLQAHGNVLQAVGRMDNAEAILTLGLALYRNLDDRQGESSVLTSLGLLNRRVGHAEAALAHFERALKIDRELGDQQAEAVDITCLGQLAMECGRLDEAEQDLSEALLVIRRIGDRREEGVVLCTLGQLAQLRGRLIDAERYLKESLVVRREIRDRQGEGVSLTSLGQIARIRGQWNEADNVLREARIILRDVQDRRNEAAVTLALGQMALDRKQVDIAVEYFRESLALCHEVCDVQGEAIALVSLGQICHALGQSSNAEGYLGKALTIVREIGDRQDEGTILFSLGQVALSRDLIVEAQQHYHEASEIYREVQDEQGLAITLAALAEINHITGNLEKAKELFLHSLGLLQKMGDSINHARVAFAYGVFLISAMQEHIEGCEMMSLSLRIHSRLDVPYDRILQVARELGCCE